MKTKQQVIKAAEVTGTEQVTPVTAPVTAAPAAATKAPLIPVAERSAVGQGAYYHGLAGKPTKAHVLSVFGKTGYALSWVSRAVKMGLTPEALCAAFIADPAAVAEQYRAATAKPQPQPVAAPAPVAKAS